MGRLSLAAQPAHVPESRDLPCSAHFDVDGHILPWPLRMKADRFLDPRGGSRHSGKGANVRQTLVRRGA